MQRLNFHKMIDININVKNGPVDNSFEINNNIYIIFIFIFYMDIENNLEENIDVLLKNFMESSET